MIKKIFCMFGLHIKHKPAGFGRGHKNKLFERTKCVGCGQINYYDKTSEGKPIVLNNIRMCVECNGFGFVKNERLNK